MDSVDLFSHRTQILFFLLKKIKQITIASYLTNNSCTLFMLLVTAGDDPIYANTRPVANKQPSPRPGTQLHPLKTASSFQNFQDLTAEGRYENGKRRNKHWQGTVQAQPQWLCFGMAFKCHLHFVPVAQFSFWHLEGQPVCFKR